MPLEKKLKFTNRLYISLKILQVVLMFVVIFEEDNTFVGKGNAFLTGFGLSTGMNFVALLLAMNISDISVVLPLEFFIISASAVIFSTGTYIDISNCNDMVRETFYNANHPNQTYIPVKSLNSEFNTTLEESVEKNTKFTEEHVGTISVVMTEKSELKSNLIDYVDTHENSSESFINNVHGTSNPETKPTKESIDSFVVRYFYLNLILTSFLCLIFHGTLIVVLFHYKSLKKLDGSLTNVEFHQTDDGEGVINLGYVSHSRNESVSDNAGVSATADVSVSAVVSRTASGSGSADNPDSACISRYNSLSTLSLGASAAHYMNKEEEEEEDEEEEEEEKDTPESNLDPLGEQQQSIMMERQRFRERLAKISVLNAPPSQVVDIYRKGKRGLLEFLREQQIDATDSREQLLREIDVSNQQREVTLSRRSSEIKEKGREIDEIEIVAEQLEKDRTLSERSSKIEDKDREIDEIEIVAEQLEKDRTLSERSSKIEDKDREIDEIEIAAEQLEKDRALSEQSSKIEDKDREIDEIEIAAEQLEKESSGDASSLAVEVITEQKNLAYEGSDESSLPETFDSGSTLYI